MASIAKATIIGNLCRDPELRVTPKGTAICQFSLAVNRDFKGDGGEKKSKVSYIDCEAWNKTAELIAKYLVKGSSAFVDGRLEQDTWVDKETQKNRTKLKVVVDNVQFLSSPKRDAAPSQDDGERMPPPPRTPPSTGVTNGNGEDAEPDVPFKCHEGPCE